MVQLEEVKDEEDLHVQPGPEDDDDYTDTESEISDPDDDMYGPESESLSERISALQDMVPPATRRKISSTINTTSSYLSSGLWFSGKAIFVLSTSLLLFGVPFGLAVMEEQQIAEAEMEQKARSMGAEVLTPGQTGDQQSRVATPTL
ncbi:mitochondrial import receptor protein [Agyrium rufum]|nr:mitochondrial import receptor protein [Agyrium rufum]